MLLYTCVALGCPFPDRAYEERIEHPSDCRNPERCSIVAVDNAAEAPDPVGDRLLARRVLRELPPIAPLVVVTLRVGAEQVPLRLPCVLGRNAAFYAALFRGDRTVSREHASLRVHAQTILIENIATSGNTLGVGSRVLACGETLALERGTYPLLFGVRFEAELDIV